MWGVIEGEKWSKNRADKIRKANTRDYGILSAGARWVE